MKIKKAWLMSLIFVGMLAQGSAYAAASMFEDKVSSAEENPEAQRESCRYGCYTKYARETYSLNACYDGCKMAAAAQHKSQSEDDQNSKDCRLE